MSGSRVQKIDRSVFETARGAYAQGKTGTLRIDWGVGPRDYFFVGGELYLDPKDPLAVWWKSLTAAHKEAGGSPETILKDLSNPKSQAGFLVELLGGVDVESAEFQEGVSEIPADAVGPLPTGLLIMEASVRNRNEFQLLRHLGGEDRRWGGMPEILSKPRRPTLDPQEAFLLSRVERPTKLSDLLTQSGMKRIDALRRVCRLEAVGLIVPSETMRSEESDELVTATLIGKFVDRVAADLETRPLEMETQQHIEAVVKLLGRLGGLNHYELLEVSPGAEEEEVYSAYSRLARMVHPSHSAELTIAGRPIGLDLLFERATEAYLTLSDPVRASRYREMVAEELAQGPLAGQSMADRREEQTRMAAEQFQQAQILVNKGDFHGAIQLVEHCIALEPKADYYAFLARCQAENPNWLEQARENLEQAMRVRPDHAEYKVQLAELMARSGDLPGGQEVLKEVLKADPENAEAVASLDDLESLPGVQVEQAEGSGLLGKLRAMLKRS